MLRLESLAVKVKDREREGEGERERELRRDGEREIKRKGGRGKQRKTIERGLKFQRRTKYGEHGLCKSGYGFESVSRGTAKRQAV